MRKKTCLIKSIDLMLTNKIYDHVRYLEIYCWQKMTHNQYYPLVLLFIEIQMSQCCCVVVYSLKCWDWLGGGSRCNSEKHLEAKLACAKSYCDTQYCYWGGGRVKGHLTFILFSILSIDSHILLILLKEWSWSWLLLMYFSKHSPVLRCLTSTIPSQSLIPG